MAEAYFGDDVDVEGDFFTALGLKDHLQAIRGLGASGSGPWSQRFG